MKYQFPKYQFPHRPNFPLGLVTQPSTVLLGLTRTPFVDLFGVEVERLKNSLRLNPYVIDLKVCIIASHSHLPRLLMT